MEGWGMTRRDLLKLFWLPFAAKLMPPAVAAKMDISTPDSRLLMLLLRKANHNRTVDLRTIDQVLGNCPQE
jgi:hypothetical protein